MRWNYLKFQQGEDAMPPSYSVRRGRLTAQLTCRTGTSYTPVKHTFKYFYLAGNVFLVLKKRTVNGVESLPRIGVLYGTAGAWKTSAVRMGDTRE